MAYAARSLGSVTTSKFRAAAFFSNLVDRLQRVRAYRATLTELSALSDRELRDLGLTRGELRQIAYSAAYGE